MNTDGSGHDPRHDAVHGAGAARGQGSRRPHRHLRLRRRPLRDGDGQEGVRGKEPASPDRGHRLRRTRADIEDAADRRLRRSISREAVPREGSRAAPADGNRSSVGTSVDRRRRHGRRHVAPARTSETTREGRAARARGRPRCSSAGHVCARVHVPRRAEAREETRFLINVPDMPALEAVSISPDGRWIAYSARDAASTAVFVRPIGVGSPAEARRHGRRRPTVLVAGQPLDRVFCRRHAEEESKRQADLRRTSARRPICSAAPGTRTTSSSSPRARDCSACWPPEASRR